MIGDAGQGVRHAWRYVTGCRRSLTQSGPMRPAHLYHAAACGPAATASIRHLKGPPPGEGQRRRHSGQDVLRAAGLPVILTDPYRAGTGRRSRIVQQATDRLLDRHGIYIQPINYPTVPRGTERLRITPTPLHGDELIDRLTDALVETWDTLQIPYAADRTPEISKTERIIPLIVAKSGG